MLVLLIAMTLGLAFLFRQQDGSGGDFAREQVTEEALAQAKAALVGYAATYRDRNPNAAFGYLPCPDTDNDGDAEANCGNQGETMVGRLPYKTLGLPDLREAGGECLWYIVSGSHKNNPKTAPLNWDALGQIRIEDTSGTALTDPADAGGGAVAAIIAPGSPLAGKNRPSGSLNCSGDTSNSIASYLDGGYAAATGGTLTVVAGQPRSVTNNDRLAWISPREIFAPLAKRNDLLGTLLTQMTTCLNFTEGKHIPATPGKRTLAGPKWVSDAQGIDEVMGPGQLKCVLDAPAAAAWNNWKDHFRYAVCSTPSSECLQLNTTTCSAVLLFAGRMANGYPRTAAEKLILANYFDAGNATALTTAATAFSGSALYAGATPENDLAICLKPAPPTLSFKDNFGELSPVAVDFNGQSLVSPDARTKTLTLGAPDLSEQFPDAIPAQLFGCGWFGTTLPFAGGLRAYFRYEIIKSDNGSGFVFAIADADPSRNPGTAMCGRGDDSLGYSGLPNDGNPLPGFPVAPIQYPKIGLEIDTRQDISRNDPDDKHMAILYWGDPSVNDDDNIHGAPAIVVPGSPQNPLAKPRSIVDDTKSGRHVRLEIVRTPNGGGHTYAIKAWVLDILPAKFNDLNADFDEDIERAQIHESANIADLSLGNEALRNIWAGFTNSASATSDQLIQITNFAIRTYP